MTEQARWARVGQALEERIDGTISLYLWDTVEPHGFAVATGRDIEPFVAPTLLAALEAALGIEAEEQAAGLIARRMLNR